MPSVAQYQHQNKCNLKAVQFWVKLKVIYLLGDNFHKYIRMR
jgi:hypothetical protein